MGPATLTNPTIIVGHREIGPGHPCFITAEISGNHNGDFQRAIKLIQAAARAGADGVKFQAFTMEEILGLRGSGQAPPPWDAMTLPELYAKVITPLRWLPALFAEARHRGVIPFASVFGPESLAALKAVDCPLYKIAKPERDRLDLIRMVRETAKPVLVSGRDIYCPGGYPCRAEELRLQKLTLSWFGLSCHCPDPLAGPVAVVYGARYLEFHLTLDDGIPTQDDVVNLTERQFQQMVRWTRTAEAMR